MTKTDFLKNNRGINDGSDLPEDLLNDIYDEIQTNEIRMKDEIEQESLLSLTIGGSGIAATLANVGRDTQKEAYITQTTGILNRTEV
jgi:brefeldin A-inhibited guanine nucleotide-exchange protein